MSGVEKSQENFAIIHKLLIFSHQSSKQHNKELSNMTTLFNFLLFNCIFML